VRILGCFRRSYVIGFPEERILHALRVTPRGASPAQLARELAMPLETLQGPLAQLQEAGFVAPRSPRVPWYALTPYGQALLKYRSTATDD